MAAEDRRERKAGKSEFVHEATGRYAYSSVGYCGVVMD